MGLRFRKSFKIAPGVRVNVGKKSIGISAGVKGARVSVNSSGRKTTTVGIPGTGLSYQRTEKIGGAKKAQTGGFDDLPKTDGVEEAFSATNSQQYTTRPDLPPAKPQEVKDKSGCGGCLTIIVAALIFFALLSSCFGGSDDKQTKDDASAADTTQTEQVDAEQQAPMITALTLDGEAPTEINVGDSCTLTYIIAPSDFLISDSVAYATTSDDNVLSVETVCCVKPARVEVTLTGKAAGTADYTVHAADSDVQETGQVTVHDRAAEQAEKEAAEKAAAEQAAAAAATQAAQEQAAAQQQGETVYITPSGKRWHRSARCAGDNAIAVTMDQVGDRTPCKKCA